jgi:hypothetical protein
MNSENGTKINRLLKAWPQGTVAVSSWLEEHGVYHQLAGIYEKHSWLERIGHGAFIKAGDVVGWEGALYALQDQLHLPIHTGGKTALSSHGQLHFIPLLQGNPAFLFGPPQLKLPRWFKEHAWGIPIQLVRTNLFSDPRIGITKKGLGRFEIRLSSRERAILELLYLVPNQQSYEEAKKIFEGLRTLRSDLMQKLLQQCRSIKVKRLCLHLAELTSQSWFSELTLSKINLGKGKRKIGEGGIYDSKYNISVPKLHEGGSAEGLEGL